jgi:hypothetical protein
VAAIIQFWLSSVNFKCFVIALLMALSAQTIEITFMKYFHLDLHALPNDMLFGSHVMLEVPAHSDQPQQVEVPVISHAQSNFSG